VGIAGEETNMKRGRPRLTMTHRRRQVLEYLGERAASGERVAIRELTRRCGIYDPRTARRIVADLKAMGAVW
jgi:transposase